WVGLVEHVLGFTDDSPPTAPAVQRRVSEVAKYPSRLARPPRLSLRFPHRRTEPLLQALVPSQTKDIVHVVALAPAHQRIARKPRVRPQNDPHVRPPRTNLLHDSFDFLLRARRGVNVRAAQLRHKQVP